MAESSGSPLLDYYLRPILQLAERRGVIEIMAVRPGEIILEIIGQGMVHERAPSFTLDYYSKLARVLAANLGRPYDPDKAPMLSTTLPGFHRLELAVGRVVESGVSMGIRVSRGFKAEWSDFETEPWLAENIENHLRRHSNIIITGQTSSGKTTLLNMLLRSVDPTERVLTAEDARELQVPQCKNRAHYKVERHGHGSVDYSKLIDHFLRMRPDRTLVGELSITNAYAVMLMLNTGHRGLVMSGHAEGARGMVDNGFYQRLSLAGITTKSEDVRDFLRGVVDLVVHCERCEDGRRRIVEVWEPAAGAEPVVVYPRSPAIAAE